MLAEPDRTPYDLTFRLFGFPVRVHPLFWIGALLLGASTLQAGVEFLAIWVAVVFVSILVHEMGHALAYRAFGCGSYIVLWIFGGLAIGSPDVRTRNQKILVSLAGPFAGFVLCGIVYGTHLATGWGSIKHGLLVWFLCDTLILVNLYWGILNLLPVYPLDGGQVSRELCQRRSPSRGLRLSFQISIAVAVAVAVYSVVCAIEARSAPPGFLAGVLPVWFPRGSFYTALLFGLLAYQSYQLMRFQGQGYYYEAPDDRLPWER